MCLRPPPRSLRFAEILQAQFEPARASDAQRRDEVVSVLLFRAIHFIIK
jgi:hypothetical protein